MSSEPAVSAPSSPPAASSTPSPPLPPKHQHLDSAAFPRNQPGARETEVTKLRLWMEQYLVPTWIYEASSDRPWCNQWHRHPDAVSVLHAVYLAWLELLDADRSGLAAPSTWIHQHLRPALDYLRAPTGPFSLCIRGTEIRHELPEPIPTVEVEEDRLL